MFKQHSMYVFMRWFDFNANPLKCELREYFHIPYDPISSVKRIYVFKYQNILMAWLEPWNSFYKFAKTCKLRGNKKSTFTNARTLDLFVFTWIQWQTHHTSEVLMHETKYWIGIFHSQKAKKLFLLHLIATLIPTVWDEWMNELINEWMMHLYSAFLCIAVHTKHFTIMWGGGGLLKPPPVCCIHLDDAMAATVQRRQCAHHTPATGGLNTLSTYFF